VRTNPLGVKGAGEAGAIVDALWRAYRIRHVDMPVTPLRLWGRSPRAGGFTRCKVRQGSVLPFTSS